MSAPLLELEVRVSRGWVGLGLAAGLFFLLSGATVSQNQMIATEYPSPAGVYDGLIVMGRTAAGAPVNMNLAAGGGSIGIRTGTSNPLAKLTVQGQMYVGDNTIDPAVQSMPESLQPALYTNGPYSGLGLRSRNSNARWGIRPNNAQLDFYKDGIGPIFTISQSGTFANMCQIRTYTFTPHGELAQKCPDNHYVFTTTKGGNNLSDFMPRTGVPITGGYMLCCKITKK